MFDKEFKEALSGLPSKEKDKLVLRLLRRDPVLAKRLYFELVSEDSVDDLRNQMEERVVSSVKYMADRFYSPGYLHLDMRDLSGEITRHVTTTKDKFGEIVLNLKMLTLVIEQCGGDILEFPLRKSRKCMTYIIARTFKILLLITKIHEDYRIDFEEDLKRLGNGIGNHPLLMKEAMHHGLDVNWLVHFSIPENIVEIHKDLRQRGYLK